MVAHERATRTVLNTQEPDGYSGGGCFDGPIEATVSIVDPTSDAVYANRRFTTVQLPVDIAVSPDGADLAVVNAGFRTVRIARMATLPMVEGSGDGDCGGGGDDGDEDIAPESAQWGAPTAAAYAPDGRLVIQWDNVIQIRNPRTFEAGTAIGLPGPAVLDGGRARFHTPTAAGIACASCHPEGLDDGLVWSFDFGDRRSQNISGNLEQRAPYHWSGDMTDLNMLMDEVLVHRMGGEEPTADQRDELTQFLFNLKPPPSPSYLDSAAVARGKALFNNDDVGCAHCHSGPLFTDNSLRDVGTGGNFKVPSLIGVSWRPPFIHTGCAKTLRDRFDPACGGDRHGGADTLTDAQLDDLITYLQSL
jgi:mono/diheme cytochrome c family protein